MLLFNAFQEGKLGRRKPQASLEVQDTDTILCPLGLGWKLKARMLCGLTVAGPARAGKVGGN